MAEVQAFFTANDIPQNHLTLLQALERQRLYADLRERASGELEARFAGGATRLGLEAAELVSELDDGIDESSDIVG